MQITVLQSGLLCLDCFGLGFFLCVWLVFGHSVDESERFLIGCGLFRFSVVLFCTGN